jgi:uncharacterized membrane protein YphA (DoxX/SURF4 family)
MRAIYLLGRAIYGGFFLYNGIHHFQALENLKGYAASKQMPYPELAVQLSGALLTASGASLLLGVKPRYGAAGTALFLATAAATMHDFWNQQEPGQKSNEMIHFAKNIALMGAALAIGARAHESETC